LSSLYARVAVPAPLKPLDTLLDYKIPQDLAGKVQPGHLVEVPFGRRKTWGLVFEVTHESLFDPAKIKSLTRLKFEQPVFSPKHLELLRWLCRHYLYPIGQVCETALPAGIRDGTARTLRFPEPPTRSRKSATEAPSLNAEQLVATQTLRNLQAGAHLLWGVTGSGKTEVYLDAIAERLRRGQGALVLVPEISLTPLVTERFERRFPGEVAIFHSGLKPTALRKAWLETFLGYRKIAIGARSALFAPVRDLGLIVLDEEHDGSYKQEDRLRYHARSAAIEFGKILNVPVVLGSATPSAEALTLVAGGAATQSRLSIRAVESAQLPSITIVDLKQYLAVENKKPVLLPPADFETPSIRGDFFLSPPLRAALDETLSKGQQSILFLNRRGLGSQEVCRRCGYTADCPDCDVKLTPHGRGLLCHYCGYVQSTPTRCPSCGEQDSPFVRLGVGTQAAEEAVRFHFPKARVLRLDRDTADNSEGMQDILEVFGSGSADVLIGTQMVAKGHDFPNVTLVGILLADIGLGVPDFRAFERSLQLLLQVSGRAGRALHPGQVLLQTFQPDHPVFETLRTLRDLDDYGRFMSEELAKREALFYPPAGRLTVLRFDGPQVELVEEASRNVAKALKRAENVDFRVLGPAPCPLTRIRGRYRWQVLLKSRDEARLEKTLGWILEGWDANKLEQKYKTRLIVDADAYQML